MPRQTASASKGEAALQVTPPAAAQAGDLKYRDQLVGAWKLLTGSIGAVTKMDEMCRRPGAAPLQALLSGAQAAQLQDIRSANEAIAVLQKLCLEAGVEVEDGATAAKQAAVSAAAGAHEAATKTFQVGDVVVISAHKHQVFLNKKAARVEKVLSRKVRVTLLEGDWTGQERDIVTENVTLKNAPAGAAAAVGAASASDEASASAAPACMWV